jgi:DNA-binding response OmpR family regulator
VTAGRAGRGLVLVVEDEPAIADLQRLYLAREGFEVQVVGDGDLALDVIRTRRPVAVVLDIGLPGRDGTDVLRALRGSGDTTPVLLVTARDDELDRILGLELGADDYVAKPFSPRELVARVKAVLRRVGAPADLGRLTVGHVTLDPGGRRVESAGRSVELTPTEFGLLEALMRRPGYVYGRDELLLGVWGYGEAVETRTVDVHIAQLRAKLGDAITIRTVRGVGYSVERDGSPGPAP